MVHRAESCNETQSGFTQFLKCAAVRLPGVAGTVVAHESAGRSSMFHPRTRSTNRPSDSGQTGEISLGLGECEAVEGGAPEVVRRKCLEGKDALTVARVEHEDPVVEDARDDDDMTAYA